MIKYPDEIKGNSMLEAAYRRGRQDHHIEVLERKLNTLEGLQRNPCGEGKLGNTLSHPTPASKNPIPTNILEVMSCTHDHLDLSNYLYRCMDCGLQFIRPPERPVEAPRRSAMMDTIPAIRCPKDREEWVQVEKIPSVPSGRDEEIVSEAPRSPSNETQEDSGGLVPIEDHRALQDILDAVREKTLRISKDTLMQRTPFLRGRLDMAREILELLIHMEDKA